MAARSGGRIPRTNNWVPPRSRCFSRSSFFPSRTTKSDEAWIAPTPDLGITKTTTFCTPHLPWRGNGCLAAFFLWSPKKKKKRGPFRRIDEQPRRRPSGRHRWICSSQSSVAGQSRARSGARALSLLDVARLFVMPRAPASRVALSDLGPKRLSSPRPQTFLSSGPWSGRSFSLSTWPRVARH